MAVGGVRQLSLITTPPVDRQAVQTHVLAWDTPTLQGAIQREIARGGQVYIVAPHIEDLAGLQDSLTEMLPAARIVTAHGQMGEGELEDAMEAFYDHEADILLATTIIESGLDVPRANTLIVYRADRFGLAQLYQLRGRVGRSSRKAFAYFILPNGPLAGNAAKRLTILQKLEGLGAGFMLASYDMDLRGFGNLLGKQQSGHIREIGFELYSKMLKEAVTKLQTQPKSTRGKPTLTNHQLPITNHLIAPTTQLKIGLTYLIPESYIADENLRLQLYRRLAGLEDAAQLADFEEELKERFGRYPTEVKHLLAVVALKNRHKNRNVSRLEVGQKGTTVAFHQGRFADPQALVSLMVSHAGIITARPDMSLVWHRRLGEGDARLKGVETIVTELETLLHEQPS
jgi:transcription-repair coupling factor (superfamily II helicase)